MKGEWGDLGWQVTVSYLRRIIARLEESWDAAKAPLLVQLQSYVDPVDEDEQRYLDEYVSEELADIEGSLLPWTRRALLLLVYAAFEDRAKALCKRVATVPCPAYLDRIKADMESSGVPSSGFGADWDFVYKARLARNAVAHAWGETAPSDHKKAQANYEELCSFCDNTPGISLGTKHYSGKPAETIRTGVGRLVTLDAEFCTILLDHAVAASARLAEAVKEALMASPPTSEA